MMISWSEVPDNSSELLIHAKILSIIGRNE